MDESSWQSVEDMDVFRHIERLTDTIWEVVSEWKPFDRDTLGKQLVRAADSIGANLVEADGRFHHRDKLNFYYIARASAKETEYWLRRAKMRSLSAESAIAPMLTELTTYIRWINVLIKQRREWMSHVKESHAEYNPDPTHDPDCDQLTN